jgi:hypothetical protein
MCKVYKQVGCLTEIKSHLRQHNVNEFKSVNELIYFQDNFSAGRQRIILDHEFLIKQEREKLIVEIAQLGQSIITEKSIVEQRLVLGIELLKQQLDRLSTSHSNVIQRLINYIKQIYVKRHIQVSQSNFDYKIAYALENLTKEYNNKQGRYQYIISDFTNAVMESCSTQIQEIERKKNVVDQLNNSIYGAIGEQKVVKELEKLSDDFILINDFSYKFNPPIYLSQEKNHIKSVQIDHILVSVFGVFLIETKNWSKKSVNDLSLRSPVQQIKRANYGLYKILNNAILNNQLRLNKHHWGDRKIPIKNLIVLINHKPIEQFQYVQILTINELVNFVNHHELRFSIQEMQNIANYLLNL